MISELLTADCEKAWLQAGWELARPISSEPLNRMNPRNKFGVWLGVRRGGEARKIEHQDRWDKEASNNVIGVPWRTADGKWTMDRRHKLTLTTSAV